MRENYRHNIIDSTFTMIPHLQKIIFEVPGGQIKYKYKISSGLYKTLHGQGFESGSCC